jgi:hypothetical protein
VPRFPPASLRALEAALNDLVDDDDAEGESKGEGESESKGEGKSEGKGEGKGGGLKAAASALLATLHALRARTAHSSALAPSPYEELPGAEAK